MTRRRIKDPEMRALRKIVDLLPLISRASRNWLTDKLQDPIPRPRVIAIADHDSGKSAEIVAERSRGTK